MYNNLCCLTFRDKYFINIHDNNNYYRYKHTCMQIIEEWENRDSDFSLPLGKYGELDSDFKNGSLQIPKRVIRNCKPKKDRQYNDQ